MPITKKIMMIKQYFIISGLQTKTFFKEMFFQLSKSSKLDPTQHNVIFDLRKNHTVKAPYVAKKPTPHTVKSQGSEIFTAS